MIKVNAQKIQYLNIIQNTITRMADNSFKIKNWAILADSGLLSLYFSKGRWQILLVTMAIIIVFFALDAYYLSLERLFRKKYNETINNKNKNLFDMSIKMSFKQYAKVIKSPSMTLYIALLGISGCILLIRYMPNISEFIKNCFYGG